MDPGDITAAYRDAFGEVAETVTIRRGFPPGNTDAVVNARLLGFAPDDVTGGAQQGSRKALVIVQDLVDLAFPLPLLPKQDRFLWNGKILVISSVDDATVRVGGVTIGFWLGIAGG
jgi:hypothetical protein